MSSGGFDPNKDPQDQGGDPDRPGGSYPPPGGGYPPPQFGNYPPPSGEGYPPPGGGFPPPPPGGYPPPPGGYPPPPGGYPPPPGGYPPPPGGFDSGFSSAAQLSVGDAISYGWRKFSQNPGVWLIFMVIAFVIQAVLNGLFNGFDFSFSMDGTDNVFTVWSLVGSIVTAVVGYLIQAAFVRGALSEVDGQKPALGTFLQVGAVGAVIVAGLLVGIATAVGLILCIVPGLVVAFLTWWTMQFVVDRNQDAITAIKSSYKAVTSNAGTLLLLALALIGINIVGALLCGLGLLVSIPVSIIASTYAYRVTTGGPVAP
ncbi:DUF2189 domain-containing protein [Rhodococcus chondri]|uniref:Integral membrane protein n=1 Tax=Rhodococcus chondri TaxID=3065941 RepID=A0ABU7JNR6_9NOCA|nr:hypothetical protein [Rhodococcus sp. CC-R104]MEE2031681.1 hypothetical protein [Rhodococcus sp. CC-R104]